MGSYELGTFMSLIPCPCPARGFTLIELLVTVALSAIVVLLIGVPPMVAFIRNWRLFTATSEIQAVPGYTLSEAVMRRLPSWPAFVRVPMAAPAVLAGRRDADFTGVAGDVDTERGEILKYVSKGLLNNPGFQITLILHDLKRNFVYAIALDATFLRQMAIALNMDEILGRNPSCKST
jgi:prepilin-type N-terminal cleavage/methylation domain-containing protein